MEILWPALGIAVIVIFVFYVLAQYWQRLLRQQNWTIRRLFERVQSLEELADPEWRRKISEAAPVPLEQVFTFTFRLGDRFWREAVRLSDDDQKFVRECGSFVGAIKLERWRSHTVATITEVLPDRKATGWQTRTLDFYSDPFKSGDAVSLWELALARPGLSAERPPSLELVLRGNSLELRGHFLLGSASRFGQRKWGCGRERQRDFLPRAARYGEAHGVSQPRSRATLRTTTTVIRPVAIQAPMEIPGKPSTPSKTRMLASNGSFACAI